MSMSKITTYPQCQGQRKYYIFSMSRSKIITLSQCQGQRELHHLDVKVNENYIFSMSRSNYHSHFYHIYYSKSNKSVGQRSQPTKHII